MKRIIMAAMVVSLAACGGDKDDVATEQQHEWESQKQSLVYSFPDNNQQEVPVPSPVVLRFSSPVMETSPAVVLREVGGPIVSDFEMEWVDGKRGLIITPDSKLKPLTEYLVQIPAIELEKGESPARSLRFTTRALFEGPKSLVAEDDFEVSRLIPDGENYPVMDFSSFRIQFSQPLDESTVKYGNDADSTIQLVGPDGLVDAYILVSGNYVTVDPKGDMSPGSQYSLNLTTGIRSIYGDPLPGGSFGNPGDSTAVRFQTTPKDTTSPTTGNRVSMVQDVSDNGEISPLTGKPINLVPMSSILLGKETATQAKGTLAAELAFVPNFPETTPFRVKRGSLIEGASIEVLIGGEVPAGFESGSVRMDFLSDATGYLLPNPYSNSDDAPRQVRLFMDVAVSTETPAANGAITQDLMHIELVGTSIVENGQMVINAIGVVEPDVLGSERATGVLSFYMKAYEDQDNPPLASEDNTNLEIQSWTPDESVSKFRNNDPLIVQFNKPVDFSGNLESFFVLEENGQVMNDVEITTRGSLVYVKPKNGFKRSKQSDSNISTVDSYFYRLTVKQGLRGVSGNEKVGDSVLEFELPVEVNLAEHYSVFADLVTFTSSEVYEGIEDVVTRSPMITAVYPGFPCLIDTSAIDLSTGMLGRCKGGLDQPYDRAAVSQDGATVENIPAKLPEDILPLPVLPENRPIIAIFTKDIDPESVVLGDSFKVGKVDEYGTFVEGGEVNGNLKVDGRKIIFYPSEPWENGVYYAYTLGSNGDRHSASANCDGSESICSVDGLPIQTQLHEIDLQYITSQNSTDANFLYQDANAANGGGDPLIQYFAGAEKASFVMQVLNAPSVDANANMIHERNTPRNIPTTRLMLSNDYNKYTIEEEGAEGQPLDPYSPEACQGLAFECQDPDGVTAPENSAKLLASNANLADVFSGNVLMPVISTGCGFNWLMDDPTGQVAFDKTVCPESKFTYLTSDLVTEVGSYNEDLGGIEVKIWPGQIMSTSMPLYTTLLSCGFCEIGMESGPQVMRMRYAKEDHSCTEDVVSGATCARNKPITAVIRNVGGQPRISASVDVYIDAIDLQSRATNVSFIATNGNPNAQAIHDVIAIPVTLNLEGDVVFNDDGTMQVGMLNSNEVSFGFGLNVYDSSLDYVIPAGYNYMVIPKYGSNVSYFSEIIK